MPMTAPRPIRSAAHAFDLAAFELCVSQVMIFSRRPFQPPLALIFEISMPAAASAGPSNGAMLPALSIGYPMMIGFPAADAELAATIATAQTAASRPGAERSRPARLGRC